MKRLLIIVCILVLIVGAIVVLKKRESPESPPILDEWTTTIAPSKTDPAISNEFGDHYVYMGPFSKGKLFVFLPGSHDEPKSLQKIGSVAASAGLHSIGLAYANGYTIQNVCNASTSANCKELVRRETITGEALSPEIEVNRTNSIENRLIKLLTYLGKTYPDQQWQQFLQGGVIRWDRVVIAGHSQGGGHAAFIAKQHEVARVVMFAAPEEDDAWTKAQSATPSDRYFGFVHTRERTGDGAKRQTTSAWKNIGMGSEVSVDGMSRPPDGAHALTTTSTCAARAITWLHYHACIVHDTYTPTEDGHPIFESVWYYMIGN